jgi:hypothetical protein
MAGQQAIPKQRPDSSLLDTPLQEFIEHPHEGCQCHHSRPPAKDLAGLAAKLCKVMAACRVVPKDKENKSLKQNYKYVSSDAVLEKANPAFVAAKLATVYELTILDRQPRTTNGGGMWELVTVRARLKIIDSETGAMIETDGIGQGYDGGDKALSKAQTQARKYALLLALNISTGEDPEADERTDKALVAAEICRKCGGHAGYSGEGDYEGQPVRIYYCEKCKIETRKPRDK